MAPTTEIALLPLKSGEHPDSEGSTTSTIHKELAQIVLSQPGCQRLYWSREVENPDNLRWLLDWDSIDDHKKFMKSEAYKPFLEKFGEILGGSPQLWHANFTSHPPSAALSTTSPATEILHIYFPTDLSDDSAADFVERVKKFTAVLEKDASGFTGSATGWVTEEIDIPDKGEKAKAFCILFGWKTVEDHQAFRETQSFKDNINLLRGAKDLKGLNVVHIHSKEIHKAK